MTDNQFVMTPGGVDVGSYTVEYAGLEPYEGNEENLKRYGPAVRLKWRVVAGDQAGAIASRICGRKMSPQSALGKFAVALKGSALQTGEAFNFDDYIGVKGSVIVEAAGDGTKVSAFIRDAAQPASQQPEAQPSQSNGEATAFTPEQLAAAAAALQAQQGD